MSKVTKKIGKILLHSLSGVVLVAILLVLVVALTFSLPRVQTFAARELTEYLSEKLGSTITLESIAIENLSKLSAKGVYIEDLKGDTLIYASRLSGRIQREALLKEAKFQPYDVYVEDGGIYLKTLSDGESNINEVVMKIKTLFPSDSTKSEGFVLSNVRTKNFHFKLYNERSAGRVPDSSIDYSDMDIRISEAQFDSIVIRDGVVSLHNMFTTKALDKSGAHLTNSSFGKLAVSNGKLEFADVDFRSDGSHLLLPYLILEGPDWPSYSNFCDTVRLSLETAGSTIEPLSAGRFVFALGNLALDGKRIVGTFDGTVNNCSVDLTASLYNSDVVVSGYIDNITRFSEMGTESNITLTTSPEQVEIIYSSLLHEPMPQSIAKWLEPFEELTLAGSVLMVPESVTITEGQLSTNLGNVEIDGTLNYSSEGVAFAGRIAGDDVQVGTIASLEPLGATDLEVEGDFALRNGDIEGDIAAEIESLVLGAYEYNNIELQAAMSDNLFSAHAISADSNFTFEMDGDGSLGSKGSEPEYNLMFSLEKADLAAMGVTKREGTSLLSGNIEATLRGRTLDDMVGRAMINNLFYASSTDTLSSEIVNISLRGRPKDKTFTLTSPIVDVDYRSTASYVDVLEFVTKTIPSALPLVGDKSASANIPQSEPLGSRLYAADDYSNISVKIIEGDHLASVFLPGAEIASMTSMEIEFSPSAQEFALSLGSNHLKVNNIVAENLRVEAGGVGSDLNLSARTRNIRIGTIDIPKVSLQVGVGSGDDVALELLVSDSDSALSGRLGVDATLGRDSRGEIVASASLADSYLLSPSQRWILNADKIAYSPQGVTIDHFSANAGESLIDISGAISSTDHTPLSLTLENITLGEWVGLMSDVKDVEGSVSGNVVLYSALGSPYGEGTLSLSPISASGVSIDPMTLNVEIPQRRSELSARLRNTRSNTTLAVGEYDYRSGEYDAQVTIEELQLSTLKPLLKNIVDNLEGKGTVALNISGEKSVFDLNGRVAIDNFDTKIGFTGAEYSIPSLQLSLENNKGTLTPARIEDKEGGWAQFEGGFSLGSGSAPSFELSLEPHNLIAIDLPENRDSSFYGKVYASSGGIKLNGENSAIVISGGLRTGNNSVFNLPLKGNSDFAGADFVTFVDSSTIRAQERYGEREDQEKGTKAATKGGSNFVVDMMLGVDRDTELRLIIDPETDNVIEARGNAELGISLDRRKGDFAIRGDYQIEEGVYNFNFQNLITKQFRINPDSYLRWNGSPLDANIDVAATYSLKTSLAPLLGNESTASRASTPVDCIVKLTGSLSKVDVSFDINVPTANTEYQSILSSYFSSQEMMATQFVYLLALGNFYSDSSTSQTTTAGTAGTAIGLDFLATQLSKLVSNDAYKFNMKYKAIDDTSSSYSIDFQTEIIDDRLTLELEANVDMGEYYQSIGENNNQLSGGGALTLRLDPAGNVNLKGFSRTIDRFDENQGLQENGVGIYFKRSFNRLSDLWRKKNKNTTTESEKSDTFVAPSPTKEEEPTEESVTEEQHEGENNE